MDFWDWLYPNWHTGYIRYYCDNITGDEVYNETFSVAYRNISSCLALGYGSISLIMTFIVIFILIKHHKEFSGSFYQIFIIASIMNSLWWIAHAVIDHLNAPMFVFLFEGIPEESIFISLTVVFSQYFMYTDLFMNVLISLNRLIAMTFVMNYERIWKTIFPIGLFIVFILPFAFTWQLVPDWIAKCMPISHAMGGQVVVIIRVASERIAWIPLSTLMFMVIISSAFVNAIINCISIVLLVLRRKKSKQQVVTTSNQQSWNREIRLFIVSFNMFLPQLLQGLIQFGYSVQFYYGADIIRFVIDYACFSPTWTLLFISKNLRNRIFRKVAPKKLTIISVMVSSNRKTSNH